MSGAFVTPSAHKQHHVHITKKRSVVTFEDDPLQVPAIYLDKNGVVEKRRVPILEIIDYGGGKKLPIRDLRRIFARNFVQTSYPIILPRPESNCYLLDLTDLKLLCQKDECLIFYPDEFGTLVFAEELRKFVVAEARLRKARDAAKRTKTATSNVDITRPPSDTNVNAPFHGYLNAVLDRKTPSFELIVLEAALLHIFYRFYRYMNLIKPVYDMVLDDITKHPDSSRLRQVLAFKKTLNNFELMVSKIKVAVNKVVRDEDRVYLYLSEKRELNDIEEIDILLEAYHADLREIEEEILTMKATLSDTNEFVNTHLDSVRNRLMQLSVITESGSFAVAMGGLIAGAFGMNLKNHLEHDPFAFLGTVMTMLILLAFVFGTLSKMYQHITRDTRGARKYQALINFFLYIDEIEKAILQTPQQDFQKEDLEGLLTKIMEQEVAEDEVNLIFQIFDDDRNGVLEAKEFADYLKRKAQTPLQSQLNSVKKTPVVWITENENSAISSVASMFSINGKDSNTTRDSDDSVSNNSSQSKSKSNKSSNSIKKE